MEENKDLNVPEGNGDNITFDYNQLYQNAQENIQPQPEQQAVLLRHAASGKRL